MHYCFYNLQFNLTLFEKEIQVFLLSVPFNLNFLNTSLRANSYFNLSCKISLWSWWYDIVAGVLGQRACMHSARHTVTMRQELYLSSAQDFGSSSRNSMEDHAGHWVNHGQTPMMKLKENSSELIGLWSWVTSLSSLRQTLVREVKVRQT